jgi:hypothetical protein
VASFGVDASPRPTSSLAFSLVRTVLRSYEPVFGGIVAILSAAFWRGGRNSSGHLEMTPNNRLELQGVTNV